MGIGGLRLEPERNLVMNDRLDQFAAIRECDGEIVVRLGEAGLEAHGFPVCQHSLVDISQAKKNQTEIIVRLRVIRPEVDGGLITRLGCF